MILKSKRLKRPDFLEENPWNLNEFWEAKDPRTGETFEQYWNRMGLNPVIPFQAFEQVKAVQAAIAPTF